MYFGYNHDGQLKQTCLRQALSLQYQVDRGPNTGESSESTFENAPGFAPERRKKMQTTLILAAIYNIVGGVTILFLFGLIAPLIRFDNSGPALFRMFVGGTAVLFGIAYVGVWRDCQQNRPLLIYGTALKYWAFAISLFGFITSTLSLEVVLVFGVGNLIFAVLFTRHLIRPRS